MIPGNDAKLLRPRYAFAKWIVSKRLVCGIICQDKNKKASWAMWILAIRDRTGPSFLLLRLRVQIWVTFGNPHRRLPEDQYLEVFLPGGRVLKAALRTLQCVFYSQTAPNKEDFVREDVVILPSNWAWISQCDPPFPPAENSFPFMHSFHPRPCLHRHLPGSTLTLGPDK